MTKSGIGTRVDVSCSTEEVDFTYARKRIRPTALGVRHLRANRRPAKGQRAMVESKCGEVV